MKRQWKLILFTFVCATFLASGAVWAHRCLDGRLSRRAACLVDECCVCECWVCNCCDDCDCQVQPCEPAKENVEENAPSPPTIQKPIPKTPAEVNKEAVEKPAKTELPTPPEKPGKKAPQPELTTTPNVPPETPAAPEKPSMPELTPTAPEAPVRPEAPEKDAKPASIDPFSSHSPDGMRVWTDISGTYTCEAKYVGYSDGEVRLQKTNGRYVRVAIDKLSVADRRIVEGSVAALSPN
jgi:hypothetical protein